MARKRHNEDAEEPSYPFEDILLQESKFYDDPIERLIYHIYRYVKRLCAIEKIQVFSTLVRIDQVLLDNEENRKKSHDCYDEYLAILQVKTLEEIYKKKGIFNKFF